MTNISLSKDLIQSLTAQGVKNFIVCAGARNAPLIKALEKCSGIDVEEYFEERAAAFYALGLTKKNLDPVAVITTSGTAVANLYPAVMEAHYAGLPLVVVTADRPDSYRGTGAPQSVNQVDIFGEHVANCFDISIAETEEVKLASDCPVHINICFDEPLIDEELDSFTAENVSGELESALDVSQYSLPTTQSFKKPLIIVGSLMASEAITLKAVLNNISCPIYAEAHSQLREDSDLNLIRSGEFSFRPEVFKENFDSLIRIGGIPTLRLWRDLEDSLFDVPVASFSRLTFTGLSRSEQVAPLSELEAFLKSLDLESPSFDESFQTQLLEKALNENPNSEVSMIAAWASELPEKSNVLVGNSLPIREWELSAPQSGKSLQVFSNRGVNGIDGLISTACGIAKSTDNPTYVLLGDLSALYDLSSLALVSKMKPLVKVVVVNNGGGMIFKRIFNDEKFENRHDWNFSQAGKMFGLSYGEDLIELKPNADETEKFWQTYQGKS